VAWVLVVLLCMEVIVHSEGRRFMEREAKMANNERFEQCVEPCKDSI
jgi:hypothetical protein